MVYLFPLAPESLMPDAVRKFRSWIRPMSSCQDASREISLRMGNFGMDHMPNHDQLPDIPAGKFCYDRSYPYMGISPPPAPIRDSQPIAKPRKGHLRRGTFCGNGTSSLPYAVCIHSWASLSLTHFAFRIFLWLVLRHSILSLSAISFRIVRHSVLIVNPHRFIDITMQRCQSWLAQIKFGLEHHILDGDLQTVIDNGVRHPFILRFITLRRHTI